MTLTSSRREKSLQDACAESYNKDSVTKCEHKYRRTSFPCRCLEHQQSALPREASSVQETMLHSCLHRTGSLRCYISLARFSVPTHTRNYRKYSVAWRCCNCGSMCIYIVHACLRQGKFRLPPWSRNCTSKFLAEESHARGKISAV